MDIYFFSNDAGTADAIKSLCGDLGFTSTVTGPGYLDMKLSDIVSGAVPASPQPVLAAVPDHIIFSGDVRDKLDMFLDAYRKRGIKRIGLKAVVTVHNLSWTLRELLEELRKEEERMKR